MIIKEIEHFLSVIPTDRIKKDYHNLAFSFDIETTSFYEGNEKRAIMYIWQFAYNDFCFMGRTWIGFSRFLELLKNHLNLSKHRKIIVYIHNISFEFQFMRKWFNVTDLFADDMRKPIYFEIDNCIQFRCSYRLSGYSLATLAKNLKNPLPKMVGDLDYKLLRHNKTELSDKELKYCENDVLIVTRFIRENIARFGTVDNIPLTQTGIVRRYVREKMKENPQNRYNIVKSTMDNVEYAILKQAFSGGFTHCNAMYTNIICNDVCSYDFTSSYPTVMIAEKYPIGKGSEIAIHSESQLNDYINKGFAVILVVEFWNLQNTFLYENIISKSKCVKCDNAKINNGRIVTADYIKIAITHIDYLCFKQFYKWDKMTISKAYIYKMDYLPKEMIECILKFYNDKTKLKGVEGMELEYLHSKEMLNSIYGMSVTAIDRDLYKVINGVWTVENNSLSASVKEYNENANRFLNYIWGVYVTAYARMNLYSGILSVGSDYIYSDTDSIKLFHIEKHKDYFDKYNKLIITKLENAMRFHGLPIEMIRPKTVDGVEKPLGVWDFDGHYKMFKSLGAKRYMMTTDKDEIKITVAGLSKSKGKEFIANQSDPYGYFCDGMSIDRDNSGRMIHTYIDNEINGVLKDYLGNVAEYHEKSFIHLEESEYNLSLAIEYLEYLKGFKALNYRG